MFTSSSCQSPTPTPYSSNCQQHCRTTSSCPPRARTTASVRLPAPPGAPRAAAFQGREGMNVNVNARLHHGASTVGQMATHLQRHVVREGEIVHVGRRHHLVAAELHLMGKNGRIRGQTRGTPRGMCDQGEGTRGTGWLRCVCIHHAMCV